MALTVGLLVMLENWNPPHSSQLCRETEPMLLRHQDHTTNQPSPSPFKITSEPRHDQFTRLKQNKKYPMGSLANICFQLFNNNVVILIAGSLRAL